MKYLGGFRPAWLSERILTLEQGLIRCMGRRAFSMLTQEVLDRRELVASAALNLRIEESQLLVELSALIRVPYLPRVMPIDLEALPHTLTLEQLYAVGCIPIFKDDSFHSVACVDPYRTRQFFQQKSIRVNDFYLSSWELIATALAKSEQIHQQKLADRTANQHSLRGELLEKVLQTILNEARANQADSCKINFCTDSPVYSFVKLDGKAARGTVANRVARELENFCHELCQDSAKSKLSLKYSIEQEDSNSFVFRLLEEAGPSPRLELIDNQRSDKRLKYNQSADVLPSILLVDDNGTFLAVLQRYFEKFKVACTALSSVDEAISLLEAERYRPDLIVSDLYLPGKGGRELLQAVRANSQLKHIPVVLLTSDESIETEIEILELVANAFVMKNEDPRILAAHVKRLLHSREAA